MSDYDESKHERDEKGRFTGGKGMLTEWSNKARGGDKKAEEAIGQLNTKAKESFSTKMKVKGKRGAKEIPVAAEKLEGYSKGSGEAGKVEGRPRDIEVPLLGKHQGFVASTGRLVDVPNAQMLKRADMPRRRAFEFVANSGSTARTQNEVLAKNLLDATIKEKKALHGTKNQPPSQSTSKQTAAKESLDKATIAMSAGLGKAHAVEEFQSVMSSNSILEWLGQLPKNHSFEISRSEDGAMQFHCVSTSAHPEYPGEKELSIDVIPTPASKTKMEINFNRSRPMDSVSWENKSTMPTISIKSSFPTNEQGKDHPFTKEFEEKYSQYSNASPKEQVKEIVENFFKDDYRSPKEEPESKPRDQTAPGYKRQGGGQMWVPKKE